MRCIATLSAALISTLPAAALAAASTAGAAAPLDGASLGRAVDAYVKPLLERGHLSGQLLIARGDQVLVERNYGSANLELKVPVTPETRFCIASITKPMTGVLAMRAIERKQIGYRDSIARWLPGFPNGERITIEHLLRHRSGIPHELLPDSESTRPRSAAEMVAIAARLPLDYPPGTDSRYSSGGYTVLARILEIATGKPYQTLIEDELFKPLGMTHSLHAHDLSLMPGRATAYRPGDYGTENAAYQDFSGLVGAGSVWSTARDIHKFTRAVVTGQLGEGARQSYVRGGKLEFSGRTSGFQSFADYDSTTGLEVVFLGNLLSGASDLLRVAVPALARGEQMTPPPMPQLLAGSVPVEQLRRLEGDFRLGNGVKLEMRVRDNRLWCGDWPLIPIADGAFFSPSDYGIVRPVEGKDGTIERLDWTQRGNVWPAPRVTATAAAR